jgi:hypothetical protein
MARGNLAEENKLLATAHLRPAQAEAGSGVLHESHRPGRLKTTTQKMGEGPSWSQENIHTAQKNKLIMMRLLLLCMGYFMPQISRD